MYIIVNFVSFKYYIYIVSISTHQIELKMCLIHDYFEVLIFKTHVFITQKYFFIKSKLLFQKGTLLIE